MLPENATTFYWRVQAQTKGGWQPWSEAAAFTAATDQHVYAHEATQTRLEKQSLEAQKEAGTQAAVEPPYLTERTSGAATLGFFAMMIVSFAIIFILIAYAVGGMQRADSSPPVSTTEQTPEAVDQAMQEMVDEAQQQQDLAVPE